MECEGTDEEPLVNSTFALIIAPTHDYYTSSDVFSRRLLKVMRNGAIPVILGMSANARYDLVRTAWTSTYSP